MPEVDKRSAGEGIEKASNRSCLPDALDENRWGDTPTSPQMGDGCPFRPLFPFKSFYAFCNYTIPHF